TSGGASHGPTTAGGGTHTTTSGHATTPGYTTTPGHTGTYGHTTTAGHANAPSYTPPGTRVPLRGGGFASVRPNGQIRSINRNGMRIQHGIYGSRTIVSVHN